MILSDAAAVLILGLAAITGTLLGLGWNLRWDRVLARLRRRLARPLRNVAANARQQEAPELALREGTR